MQDETHVMRLTPAGRAAVATLLIEGPRACEAVGESFQPAARKKSLSSLPLGRIVFGRWGGVAGEEVVVCRITSKQIELCCHGGRVAVERIERDLVAAGCRTASWPFVEEPTFETEARIALSQARTQRTAAILLDQFHGALDVELAAIERLRESDPQQARQRLQVLEERALLGSHLVAPWRIVLAGKPNVGKSSLINALAGYQRAIVFDEPGTTRDVVTADTAIDGWPVELADTAGLRDTADDLEAAGIARARQQMAAADVLLLVFDATQPWSEADAKLVAQWPDALVVLNKRDLVGGLDVPSPALPTSAVTRQGIDELIQAVSRRLVPNPPPAGSAVPFTPRQMGRIEAIQHLIG